MPTYDYKCNACRHAFELFQSMRDPLKRKCPKCGKNALERLIGTGAAVVFKGSGFYQTDYRSDSYKKAAEADSKPASTDSKPADNAAKPAADAKPKAAEPPPAARKSSAKRSKKPRNKP